MLTICFHANVKTSSEPTMLTVVSCCLIYEASTVLLALVYHILLQSSLEKTLFTSQTNAQNITKDKHTVCAPLTP